MRPLLAIGRGTVSAAALALLLAGLHCGAKTTLPCRDDGVAGGSAYECTGCEAPATAPSPPSCEGTGLVFRAPDACVDDGGQTQADDELQVYCSEGIARFCLSHEQCPWRDGTATSGDGRTCSRAGLRSAFFAAVRGGCDGFQGHRRWCCTRDGRIGYGDDAATDAP